MTGTGVVCHGERSAAIYPLWSRNLRNAVLEGLEVDLRIARALNGSLPEHERIGEDFEKLVEG
jgi:hypothetical protein